MKINSISTNCNQTNFKGVKEAETVWQKSKPTIQEALNALGDKNISIIMQGNSFPSLPNEDIGIGSPYTNGAKEVANFWSVIADKCILGPWGITANGAKHSPYNSTLESQNPFFIDFKLLTTDEGYNLLSPKTFNNVVKNNPAKTNQINYEYVENVTSKMLDEAFDNYTSKLKKKDLKAIELKNNINNFKKNNTGIYLDAIFNCLKDKYGTSDFNEWNEIDKTLPILLDKDDKKARERLANIYTKNQNQVDKYMFIQYLANEHKENAPMKYVADKQVAIERTDVWKLQDIILSKIGENKVCLGVPGDAFSPKGRCWGMPQIDIKKVFNEDGSLSSGGQRLYKIYKKIFADNKGGVRIDHFQGVIDPYICINDSAEIEDGAGRLLSSPGHRLLNAYSIITKENLDETRKEFDYNHIKYLTKKQVDEYAKFFEKVILAAAKSEGLSETDIMPEDLGSITKPTVEVMKKNHLGSMKVTEFVNPKKPEHMYRGRNSSPKDFITTGTHDSKPLVLYFEDMTEGKYYEHLNMLKEDLSIKRLKTRKDKTYGIKLKFAELFTAPAKNVQIFFSHLLGLSNWYNKPGDKTVKKWSLRMPNNFKEIYFENLEKGLAFNPFDSLARALTAKDSEVYKPIINKLKRFEKQIIKEFHK